MPLPGALAPLRYPVYRLLWTANLASNIGLWVQNTAAGWMMTSLAPSPAMVSLVQAASTLPVFLLALPAGALADIIDRRVYLIGAQIWVTAMALLLALLTGAGVLGAWGLLVLTFAIGAGQAMNFPGWAATTPELVPREDLVQAIALNGVGFNLSRAVGPALGGFVIGLAGIQAAFLLAAASFGSLIVGMLFWRREVRRSALPPEHFLGAVRAGVRFVAASPPMRATILRACVFFFFSAAIWALLPLLVRQGLGLGPEAFGLFLTAMGAGAVAAGLLLPSLRARLPTRGATVLAFSLVGCVALALLALVPHWLAAVLGMALFGVAWIGAASTLQAAAQMAAPAWVRARAIAIYQLSFFGALTLGAVIWGWAGDALGTRAALGVAAAAGAVGALAVRGVGLDRTTRAEPVSSVALPNPEAPAAELARLLAGRSGRVLEVVRYTVLAERRADFLAAMQEVRRARLRAGAAVWRLYEDIAHPERFVELWAVESWEEHLREASRLGPEDRAALARVAALHAGEEPPEAARYLNVQP